ncbi:UNVERIFIED_CONTAM: hypothetical protein O8I53_13315 [Campylobacter lari]
MTNEERNKNVPDEFGILRKADNGLRLFEYIPDQNNEIGKERGNVKSLFIDASNEVGLKQYLDFIKSPEGKDIGNLFFKNIGLNNKNQDMSEYYKAIPDTVKILTLDYETHNMFGIRELRNKKFDDVQLITQMHNINNNMGDKTGPGVSKYNQIG